MPSGKLICQAKIQQKQKTTSATGQAFNKTTQPLIAFWDQIKIWGAATDKTDFKKY